MKKNLLLWLFFASGPLSYAQVGINNQSPAVTLDITPKATDGSRSEGIIIPKMTGDALRTANINNLYGAAQNATLIYVTAPAAAGNLIGQTIDLTSTGFFFFDSSLNRWVKLGAAVPNNTNLNKTAELTGSYTALATDDIILFNNPAQATLTLPTTGILVGKKIFVSSINSAGVDFAPAGVIRNTSYNSLNAGTSATLIFLGPSQWDVVSGY